MSLRTVLYGATLGLLATGGGTAGYWVYVQPDPAIVARETPVPNRGVSLGGLRLPGERMSMAPPEWQAKAETDFRPGETLWVLRHDCFFNKLSGPVQRAFIGDDGAIHSLPLIWPPKTTPSGHCARANFAVPIPGDLKPGWYTYSVNVIFYKNPLQREVITPFAPVRLRIVE